MRTRLFSLFLLTLPIIGAVNGVIQPEGISLVPLQQQLFTLPGYSQGVTWSVQPFGMGTITPSGLYTAPNVAGIAFIYAQTPDGTSYMTTVYLTQGLGGSSAGLTGISPSPTTPVAPLNPSPLPTLGPAPSSGSGLAPLSPSSPPYGASSNNVSVSVYPTSVFLQPGQSAVFTAAVQGTTSDQVEWSISPKLGSMVNGLYKAPSSVAHDEQVTISATPKNNSSKKATATVMLGVPVALPPISVSLLQGATTLAAGQTAQFTAMVQGTTNTAVTWTLSPNVGSIVNGLYTAPSSVSSQTIVVVTATSIVDPTKSASLTVTLTAPPPPPPPAVTLSLTPGSVSLNGGQSATFAATVSGTSNTAVTWSLSPQVGTITNGVYQAPATIATQQTVTVTATSSADSTKTASAVVSLQPVGVAVGPVSVSLNAGGSATFTASVTGTANTAVTWSMNPSVGTLVNGVYTAPVTINSILIVTLTATSVADTSKAGAATVTLTPSASSGQTTTVTLPLEVIGPNGTTASASVTIPSGANLSGPLTLYMQIHGLRFETQASVQVNNSGWMPISDSTVTLQGRATAYGGIGGGFSTLKMTMNLPAGSIQAGSNNISFRFNQTDGRVSGFRVLAFNILAGDGSQLLPSSTFVYDDPNNWQPPSSSASDIAAGQTLWHQAALTVPVATGGTQSILAHCSDCHATDGRDLKYFNYSNNSIQARALFHGLTAQQGVQIASYIRSLSVANPGRPWNPPYQPGPGLDSQPVINWAAGAGLDAVLDSDQEMVAAMFPSGFQDSVFAATSRLNQRETPLPLQLPDWNQWLPGTHPMDAFGSTFTTSGYNTIFQTLSSNLQVLSQTAYVGQQANFDAWFNAFYNLYTQVGTPIWNVPGGGWTPATTDAMYSLSQWGMVRTWELMNEFQLEGLPQAFYGPNADPRGWTSFLPFFVSPHELKMNSAGTPGLRNGSRADYVYLSYIWYNLQLILNNSDQRDHFPIDYPYIQGFIKDMGSLVAPQAGLQTMWFIKGLQAMQEMGYGPQLGLEGWQPSVSQIANLVTKEWNYGVWTGVDPGTRAALTTGMIKSWLAQASQFTPQQFYTGGWTTANAVPVPGGSGYDGVFVDSTWYTIPRLTFVGVDSALVGQLAMWAQSVWPGVNWTVDLNATCSWLNNVPNDAIACSQ